MSLYESLPYQTIKKDGIIEIRKYNDFLLASTKTKTDNSQSSGFSNVFRYISGNNSQNQKISMTTPVVTYQEEDELVTGFYVPSKFNKDSVPKPSSKQVFINEMKSSLYAVIRFRGSWTEKNLSKYDDMLQAYIHTSKYEIISKRFLLRYQPPFIPGIFRNNEIAYQVKERE